MEAARITVFFQQILAAQSTDDASRIVYPPALMETIFHRHGSHFQVSKNEFKVKLCCVALPIDCSVEQATSCDPDKQPAQKLFVGFQWVQSADVVVADSGNLQTRSSEFG